MITLTIISNMKLAPIKTRNNAAAVLFGFISKRRCLKKITQKIEKRPVFTIGEAIEARIEPNKSFLFLRALAINPATTPAAVVLIKHVITVPTGLAAKK